jgi:hypothetical protein
MTDHLPPNPFLSYSSKPKVKAPSRPAKKRKAKKVRK